MTKTKNGRYVNKANRKVAILKNILHEHVSCSYDQAGRDTGGEWGVCSNHSASEAVWKGGQTAPLTVLISYSFH